MNQEELNRYCKELENIILSISKNDWDQILVHIVEDELRNSTGIFYKQANRYICIREFVDEGTIDENEYKFAMFNMIGIVSKIKKIFTENKSDVWNTMIFIIKKESKYEISCTYEELDNNLFIEEIVWRYKYLNIVPNEANMKYIEGVEQTLLECD